VALVVLHLRLFVVQKVALEQLQKVAVDKPLTQLALRCPKIFRLPPLTEG
jgi:hypothetical protein